MSGRRSRYETVWEDKEEKRTSSDIHSNVSPGRSRNWSKSELHDDLMHGNFSRSPSWDPMQGNRHGSKDDEIRRDRNRMYSHPNFDGREKQYSTHPSDDGYGLPYRSWDKGVGGNARMSRETERERTNSPNGSRSRSRDGMSRSSRESTRSHRHETNVSYPNMRNSSKDFASRGGGNNIPESWSRRTDYKDGSRYEDQPHRNVYDDHRNNRIPCKFFAAGNCNRGNCRFSHDVPEAAGSYDKAAGSYDDNRNVGNTSRTWRNDQQPRDDLNANSKHAKMDKKYSSSWDDVKSGSFDETSRQCHTLDENNNNATWDTWDDRKKLDGHASRDASGFHDVGKSHPNLDNKKSSWNGPTSWDGVSGSGFGSVSNPCPKYVESTKESLDDDDAMGRMCAKSGSNIGGSKRKKWDGPLWDEASEPVVVETDNKKIRKWEDPGLKKMVSDNVEIVVNKSDLSNIASENSKQEVLTSGKDLLQKVHDMNTQSLSYADGSEQSGMLLSNPFNGQVEGMNMDMENQNKSGKDLIQNIHNMNTQSLSYADGSEQSCMLLSNPINGPLNGLVQGMYMNMEIQNKPGKDLIQNVHDMNTQSLSYAVGFEQSRIHLSNPFNGSLNGQVQGMYMDMENQNNGGKPLKPLEMNIPQPQAVNHVIETSLTSHHASQANELPAEISHKEQLSQLYTDLHLSNAIDYLKSLPSSAYSQDTKAKEEQNSVKNMEDKTSAPMGILSGSVTQQNQTPADLTHDSSQLGGIGVMQKEAVKGIDKRVAENRKKEEQSTNRDNSEAQGKVEEGDIGNDEKAMRQFKAGLVEFVKEILKPKWKEGKMSREVHKNVVKKVVEKVTSSIQGTQIPRTQPKIEQYLAHSKPKITKLVEAYMERLVKA